MNIANIDLYEVNEALAPVPLAWLREIGADPARLDVNGGAIRSAIRSAPAAPSR
jgi:acetyl-CoA C-acetyltransferase